jgi:hypothetical protein
VGGGDGLEQALVELQELAERLRRDCPWDRAQTAATIVPHTVEEAYEVADAAQAEDDAALLDELGDLLFQTVFLALPSRSEARATSPPSPAASTRSSSAGIPTSSATPSSRPRRPSRGGGRS